MLKRLIILTVLLLLTGQLFAQEGNDWASLHTPGEAHRKLDALAGTWKTTTQFWMAGPQEPPSVSEGTSTFEWVLDGRFLEERTDSHLNVPGENGELQKIPFTGRGLTGYDTVRKLYVSTWVDSMSTQITYIKGQFSADGKTLTMYGEMDEPMQGVYGGAVRMQTVLESKDRHIFTIYDLHSGEDVKMLEIVYER